MEKISLESGQGLELQLTVAGVGARSYAFIIDWHIRFVLAFAWFMAVILISDFGNNWLFGEGGLFDGDEWGWFTLLISLPPMIIYFLYHPILEILMNGQTPGKRITGVRIVRQNGMPAGVAQHLIRNIFRLIDSMPAFYCFGLVVCFLNSQHLRIGDLAAGTVLVYVDHNTKSEMAELESVLEDSKLSLEQNQLLHELIQRWPKLDNQNRRSIATEFLTELGRMQAGQQHTHTDKQLLEMLRETAGQ